MDPASYLASAGSSTYTTILYSKLSDRLIRAGAGSAGILPASCGSNPVHAGRVRSQESRLHTPSGQYLQNRVANNVLLMAQPNVLGALAEVCSFLGFT
jgi:hypothetical protein